MNHYNDLQDFKQYRLKRILQLFLLIVILFGMLHFAVGWDGVAKTNEQGEIYFEVEGEAYFLDIKWQNLQKYRQNLKDNIRIVENKIQARKRVFETYKKKVTNPEIPLLEKHLKQLQKTLADVEKQIEVVELSYRGKQVKMTSKQRRRSYNMRYSLLE